MSGRPSSPPPSSSPSSSSAAAPAKLSANRVHELAVQAFRIGNRGKLSLCEALRVLSETRLYLDLGFPSLVAYADAFFELRRAETFESVRVAQSLLELTELRDAFGQGRIGWSSLKAITRVASVDSQSAWIDFARRNGVERTVAEARDALRRGRDAPRDSAYGLPNLDQRLVLRFSRSDMEKVRTWIEATCATIIEKTGAERVALEQAVLFLCERDTAQGADTDAEIDNAKGQSHRAQIVYQRCPDCSKARMGTSEGFVEVAAEEVGRYEGTAEQVVIDGPTPPRMRRQILGREGGRCGNPLCRHRADHCHHIVFRSRGGKSELANEIGVCATCHALIHAGLLEVRGQANEKLCWTPIVKDGSVEGVVGSLRVEAERLPSLVEAIGTTSEERTDQTIEESAIADSVFGPSSDQDDDLIDGLTRLGVPAARSRRLIAAAYESLPAAEVTEAKVLRAAIAAI